MLERHACEDTSGAASRSDIDETSSSGILDATYQTSGSSIALQSFCPDNQVITLAYTAANDALTLFVTIPNVEPLIETFTRQ